ncbi:hypothetical protein sos41_11830 [Alphaproteobacteria bacterium SO-S41]|nr:hypothetical protein sos41_11830 [Alphaproteobacteria bacterium SO-S41]
MSVFDPSAVIAAAEGIFGDSGIYTPPLPAVGPVAVAVIARREDSDFAIGPGRAIARRGLFEVRASYFEGKPDPVRGGVLTITSGAGIGESWKIEVTPEKLDPDRLVWTWRCGPA